mgnify:CR=1 FL=1
MKRFIDALVATVVAAGLVGFAPSCAAADAARWAYTGRERAAEVGQAREGLSRPARRGTSRSPDRHSRCERPEGDLPPLLFNFTSRRRSRSSTTDTRSRSTTHPAAGSRSRASDTSWSRFDFHKPSEMKISGKGAGDGSPPRAPGQGRQARDRRRPSRPGQGERAGQDAVEQPAAGEGTRRTSSPTAQINAAGLLPQNKDYYTFKGSLTAPPCTENVSLVRAEDARTDLSRRNRALRKVLPDERAPGATAQRSGHPGSR